MQKSLKNTENGDNILFTPLTLILLTWRIWWTTNNSSKWQMAFKSGFKESSETFIFLWDSCQLLLAVVGGLLSLCSFPFLWRWMAFHKTFHSLQLTTATSCNYSCTRCWWWVSTPETYRAAYRNVINWIQSHLVGQLLNSRGGCPSTLRSVCSCTCSCKWCIKIKNQCGLSFCRVPLLIRLCTTVITLMSLSAQCPVSRTTCHLLTSSLCWHATCWFLLCCLSGEC